MTRKPKQLRTCLLCEATSAGRSVTFRHKRDICDWCYDDLTARGLAWCARGKHKVDAATMMRGVSCRACNNTRNRAYVRDRREQSKAWREQNRERTAAYRQRSDVRDRRRATAYDRYWKNPDYHRAKAKESYYRRRERVITGRRMRYRQNVSAERAAGRYYYQRAKVRAWKEAGLCSPTPT